MVGNEGRESASAKAHSCERQWKDAASRCGEQRSNTRSRSHHGHACLCRLHRSALSQKLVSQCSSPLRFAAMCHL